MHMVVYIQKVSFLRAEMAINSYMYTCQTICTS